MASPGYHNIKYNWCHVNAGGVYAFGGDGGNALSITLRGHQLLWIRGSMLFVESLASIGSEEPLDCSPDERDAILAAVDIQAWAVVRDIAERAVERSMPKRETTLTYTVEEVEKALRKALSLPDHAHIEFEVEDQEDPDDWRAALPLQYVFVGITVSYEEE